MIGDILMSVVFAFLHWVRSDSGSAEIDMLEAGWHASQGQNAPPEPQPQASEPAQQFVAQSYPGRKKQSSTIGMADQ